MVGLAAALRLAEDADEARLYSRAGGVDPYTAALDAFETEQATSGRRPTCASCLAARRVPSWCRV